MFNCGSFDPKVKDCPNPNKSPSLKIEGSVHKPSLNPPQTNRGARPKDTQAAGTSRANKASGLRGTHALMLRGRGIIRMDMILLFLNLTYLAYMCLRCLILVLHIPQFFHHFFIQKIKNM